MSKKEYQGMEYWEDYFLDDKKAYNIPDYRFIRLHAYIKDDLDKIKKLEARVEELEIAASDRINLVKLNVQYLEEIKNLESLLKEACRVIGFYGNENNWERLGSREFRANDLEDYVSEEYHSETQEVELILEDQIMGKKARAFLEKNGEALSEVRDGLR